MSYGEFALLALFARRFRSRDGRDFSHEVKFANRKMKATLGWMTSLQDFFEKILGIGLEPKDLNYLHVALRGIIVFIAALIILRVGNKRFLSKMSAFDAILGFILASMLAR